MFNAVSIRVQGEYFASFAQQVDQVPSISTARVEHDHAGCDVAAQDLIEHVDINLSELLLNVQRDSLSDPQIIHCSPSRGNCAGYFPVSGTFQLLLKTDIWVIVYRRMFRKAAIRR
jgi:hypothetical protein